MKYEAIDPRMLSVEARRVDMTTGANISYVRTPLATGLCDKELNFQKIPKDSWDTGQL